MREITIAKEQVDSFCIGQPIRKIIEIIKKKTVSELNLDVKFNKTDPFSENIVIQLNTDGILLRFTSDSQRLIGIELFKLDQISIRYQEYVFSSARDYKLTYENVRKVFQLAKPGTLSRDKSAFIQTFPGLAFIFDIPKEFQPNVSKEFEKQGTDYRLEIDGKSPVASRIIVFPGKGIDEICLPRSGRKNSLTTSVMEVEEEESQSVEYFEPIIAFPSGMYFPRLSRGVFVGASSVQDVLCDVGHPEEVFYKKENKFGEAADGKSDFQIGDYFYNYYRFGFDILFNGQQHIVKKIILHTNIPGCHEFGVYSKANFVFSPEKEFDLEKAKAKKGAFDCNERFDSREGMSEPLINDLGKEAMKFGPSLFYSYKGAVLEVFDEIVEKKNGFCVMFAYE